MFKLLARLALLLWLPLTWAQNSAPAADDDPYAPPRPMNRQQCRQDPETCHAQKARLQAWCAAHPQRCEALQQRRQARRAACQADPQQCREQRAARRLKRCQNNSSGCKPAPSASAPAPAAMDDDDDDN